MDRQDRFPELRTDHVSGRRGVPLSNMSANTLVMSGARTGGGTLEPDSRVVRVEFRAATPDEIAQIDMTSDEVSLPAHVFLTHARWREAIAPFPIGQPFDLGAGDVRSWRSPGSMVWAQLASRSRDMIVGGRDRFGLPSIPVPTGNGDIFFASVVSGPPVASPGGTPLVRLRRLLPEPHDCQPILSADGPIECASADCDGCLRVLTRNNWNTTIGCVCGHAPVTF